MMRPSGNAAPLGVDSQRAIGAKEAQPHTGRAESILVVVEEHDGLEIDLVERVRAHAVHRDNHDAHELDVTRARQQWHLADAVALKE